MVYIRPSRLWRESVCLPVHSPIIPGYTIILVPSPLSCGGRSTSFEIYNTQTLQYIQITMSSQYPPIFSPRYASPMSTGLLSPMTQFNPSPYLGGSLGFTNSQQPLKQETYYDDESSDSSYVMGAIRTPSATPEPNQEGTRSSLSFPNDPIIENLNRLRVEENRTPLQPVHGLHGQGFANWANPNYTTAQDTHNAPRQLVPTAQKPKRRPRSQLGPSGEPRPPHCNIKYTTEELDYIRYQRVDLGLE
ncbi:hypothetical protein F4678DRAFT_71091 [Xylaria arbuscula]|nr:hypothetical protein F4678DRAFT_71091 [Xylaria arbuscula]